MKRRVWPVEIPTNSSFFDLEKEVYVKIKHTKTEGWFLVDIDPIGMNTEKVKMGLIIIPDKGIISFSMHDSTPSSLMATSANMYIKLIEEKMYNLLLESAMLIVACEGKKLLKFPYKHIVILDEVNDISHNKCFSSECVSTNSNILQLFEKV